MIRLWLRLTLLLSTFIILVTASAVTLGTLKAPDPALTGFGYCAGVPCWMNIDLQTATLNVADTRLIQAGYSVMVEQRFYQSFDSRCDTALNPAPDSNRLLMVYLINCRGLILGDLMSVFGTPDRIWVNGMCQWGFSYGDMMTVYVDGQLVPRFGRVSLLLNLPISQIDFPLHPLDTTAFGNDWIGFATLWRYDQLNSHANMSYCR